MEASFLIWPPRYGGIVSRKTELEEGLRLTRKMNPDLSSSRDNLALIGTASVFTLDLSQLWFVTAQRRQKETWIAPQINSD